MATSNPVIPYDFDTPLLAAARRHVLQLWNDQHDARLVFHNFSQAAGVAEKALEIGRAETLPAELLESVLLAAWFHNIGYLYDLRQTVETGAIRAEFFLSEQKCPPEKIRQVRQCLLSALHDEAPKTPEAQVLADALRVYDWVDTYAARLSLLRLERELLQEAPLSEADWQGYVQEQLEKGTLRTAYAKKKYEPVLAGQWLAWRQAHPAPVREAGRKKSKEKEEQPERFSRLARRPMRSSIQTYFRANYANHIRLSAIADNKAHIMISVNSILLSVAISMLTYQSLTSRNPLLILPIIIFLVTSLGSLIFAVLSSRPRVTTSAHLPDQTVSPVFFGSFVHLSLEQYETAVDAMLRDGQLLFGNMARDLYHLGLVLDKKYRLLTYSYTVFMMGFVATVGAFLGAYFLG